MIVAHVFGLLALIFLMWSIQSNNKSKILVLQIVANTFFGIQYILLNAMSAMMMSIVAIIRGVIYNHYAKIRKKVPGEILIILFMIIVGIAAFTVNNIIGVIPMIATLLHTYGTWQDNLKRYRVIIVVAAVGWLIFNFSVGAYVSVISSIFELVSGIVAIYRFDTKKKTNIS